MKIITSRLIRAIWWMRKHREVFSSQKPVDSKALWLRPLLGWRIQFELITGCTQKTLWLKWPRTSRFLVWFLVWPYKLVQISYGQFHMNKRKRLTFDLPIWTFLGWGDKNVYHSKLCFAFFGLCSNAEPPSCSNVGIMFKCWDLVIPISFTIILIVNHNHNWEKIFLHPHSVPFLSKKCILMVVCLYTTQDILSFLKGLVPSVHLWVIVQFLHNLSSPFPKFLMPFYPISHKILSHISVPNSFAFFFIWGI